MIIDKASLTLQLGLNQGYYTALIIISKENIVISADLNQIAEV